MPTFILIFLFVYNICCKHYSLQKKQLRKEKENLREKKKKKKKEERKRKRKRKRKGKKKERKDHLIWAEQISKFEHVNE